MAKSNDILPLLILGFVAYKLFYKKDPINHPPDLDPKDTDITNHYQSDGVVPSSGIGRVTSWQEFNYRGDMRTCERGAHWWEPNICTPWQRQYS